MTAVWRNYGIAVIHAEAEAIQALATRIDQHFIKACELLLACQARLVVMGMGKSSYIGGKIAATLASTGSPAFFVHPGEASHGDLGMITAKDVVIAISHSGETPEILAILPLIKHLAVPLVSLTGNARSTLAQAAQVNLDVSVAKEACPMNLAPTASSTAALVMGDALAVTLLQARGFTAADYARSHPGGRLGKRLLLKVGDVMRSDDDLPQVTETTFLTDALIEMTKKTLGMTLVVDAQGKLSGIYTDGDLRRTLSQDLDIRQLTMQSIASNNPKTIVAHELAVSALQIMEEASITTLAVIDQTNDMPIGVVHMQDLLRAGVA